MEELPPLILSDNVPPKVPVPVATESVTGVFPDTGAVFPFAS